MLIAGMVVLGIALEETGLADAGRVAACFELEAKSAPGDRVRQ